MAKRYNKGDKQFKGLELQVFGGLFIILILFVGYFFLNKGKESQGKNLEGLSPSQQALYLVQNAKGGTKTVKEAVELYVTFSEQNGNLVERKGWSVTEHPERKGTFLVRYDFRENAKDVAFEWAVDPAKREVVPLSEFTERFSKIEEAPR